MIEAHIDKAGTFHTTGDFLLCECGALVPKLPHDDEHTCPECKAVMLNEDAADADVEVIVARYNAHERLLALLRSVRKPLIRLGDFVGNFDKGGVSGMGPIDRCAIIHSINEALSLFPDTPLDPEPVKLQPLVEHHTKGPWHLGQGNGEGSIFAEDGRTRFESGTVLYPIAKYKVGWDDREDDANGRLMVLGPQFHSFCKEIVQGGQQGALIPPHILHTAQELLTLAAPPEEDPTEALICTCCGRPMRGRQWWNRDNGYGLCKQCIPQNADANIPTGQTARSFGIRGHHYDLPGEEA